MVSYDSSLGYNPDISKEYKMGEISRSGQHTLTRQKKYTKSGWDLADWFERLTANAKVATVLGSIPASSDTMDGIWEGAGNSVE